MLKLFLKTLSVPRNIIPIESIGHLNESVDSIGKKIQEVVRRQFNGSLAIRQVDAGSDNATEQELVALSNTFYDVERFNIHFVASPKHADMLMVTGPVTRNMAEALRRAYQVTPNPKIVVAVGDDAIDGGIFKKSYATEDGVKNIIPVDYHIPGDPPSPKTILLYLLRILKNSDKDSSKLK